MKKTKLRGILTCLAVVPLLGCTEVNNDRVIEKNGSNIISSRISDNPTNIDDSTVSFSDSIKDSLTAEVTKYVNKYFPKTPSEVPGLIVKYGLENNIDICFMMAQTHIETGFGTAGIGRPTSRKSIFGFYVTYATYDKCVAHYVATLKKHYLTKGRTEQDLMKKYVTTGGTRYAGNPNYEVTLSKVYKDICRSTDVQRLQSLYYENIEKEHNNETVDCSIKGPYKPIQIGDCPWRSGYIFDMHDLASVQ